jgi:hypothetical protein
MSWPMWIALVCHLAATGIIAGLGVIYILRTEFMSYHAAALGMNWGGVPHKFQVLILALMKAVGSAGLAVVVLELFLLFVPFWQGAIWARWAIPGGGIVISSGALYAMVHVLRNAPPVSPLTEKPPLWAPVSCILLFATGLVFSLL